MTEKAGIKIADSIWLIAATAGLLLIIFIFWINRAVKSHLLHKRLQEIGRESEEAVYHAISRLGGYKRILTNVYLPSARGNSTTEVDLIYLCRHGIYVLESKGYSGWIFGEKDSRNWLRTLPNGSSFQFYNPIAQNEGHIHALMKFLGIDNRRLLKSIIVFSDKCTFKRLKIRRCGARVVHAKKLRRAMKRAAWGTWFCLSRRDILDFYQELLPCTKVSNSEKRQHIKDVKRKASR